MVDKMDEYVNICKALADKTRLRIIWLLKKAEAGLCVCEITDALNESQYNISRHLKELKIAGLIQDHKQGRWNFYALASAASQFQQLILQAIATLSDEILDLDYARLQQRLALRENEACVVGVNSDTWRTISRQFMTKGETSQVL
jgi:ArsR family transcriptional regulator